MRHLEEEERDDFEEWTSLYAEFYLPGSRVDLEFRASRLLVMAARSWVYRTDNLLRAETGQTRARWQILFTMAFAEQPVTMSEVAARLKVQWPTMARVVEGMERDGLLKRQNNPADGRSKLLHLTPNGTALIEQIQPILDRERAHLLIRLSEDDLKTCADLLQRIFEAAIRR